MNDRLDELRREAARGRAVIEGSPEIVVVLDERERVVAASRRAREALDGLEENAPLPSALLARDGEPLLRVPYEVNGRRETLVYFGEAGQLSAYEELRAGFTASVSHELRTPLARLLSLLETALLPGSDLAQYVEQARAEVQQVQELIDDVLFLSELETGRRVVALGSTQALPVLREVVAALRESAERAGVALWVEGDEDARVPLRPRMLRVAAENLVENAIRYAGPDTRLELTLRPTPGGIVLSAADDGAGVSEADLPRLFERFYRGDRARTSRGTGLGLAIVKHVVGSAGGTVEALGGRGGGLTIHLVFPATDART